EGAVVKRRVQNHTWAILLIGGMLTAELAYCADKKSKNHEETTISGPGILWREPMDIASRKLYYGAGGEEHQPKPPFQFVKEDLEGSSPKFTVTDAENVSWKVKLGQEARPETAATRLAWAVGYFTDEDYLFRNMQVQGLPVRLHRGQNLISRDGEIAYARLKRESKSEKKLGIWDWRDPYWSNSRELNGLKVIMALLNNWDLKNINNQVIEKDGERIFKVKDMGASFGTPGRSFPQSRAKDNLEEYKKSQFIRRTTDDTVDFTTPARPQFVYLVNPKEYTQRVKMESLGHDIPREDVWWMGQLLACLSPKQIRDAFRAAGYSDADVEEFAAVIEKRIAMLTDL
ncbi:MAG TPA: hypothetical protein VKE70_23085, partial [Candidatus Solibacter sp.]|nr:hypothetical protein [Candidatus Solibacter sp.]